MITTLVLLAILKVGSTSDQTTMKINSAQTTYVPFQGEKSVWHDGFDRYDFVMDAQTQAVSPFKAPENEHFGIGAPNEGQRRCVVICPKQPAPGNPWSWRGCYWDHQPQTEVELLHRGFHIAYISADANLKPDKNWDAWYDYLTQKHGLSKKPTFVGMSRGGLFELRWATTHPDRVSGIYADNPAADDDIFRNLPGLIHQDVPILFVCGTNDPLLAQHSLPLEAIYQQFGGRASMLLKDGAGHHPHSLNIPKPIADFLEASTRHTTGEVPGFVGTSRFERTSFYSIENSYAWHPEDGYYITSRGAAFAECYDQYKVWAAGVELPTTIIIPKIEAPGKPWILRSSHVDRNDAVDLALLAKGFHIVIGPVGYNADGPIVSDWNKVYSYLIDHGFSRKVALEGEGGGAGSVYGWAVENPDKVACVYAKNPVMHAAGYERQPIDHLDQLSKAGVKLLHINSDLTPELSKEQNEVEKHYRALKGEITVIHEDSRGDQIGSKRTNDAAVNFIIKNGALKVTAHRDERASK